MPNQSAALRELARQVTSLDRRVRAIGSGGQLGNSSFENGAISGYSGDSLVMQIGLQWDGTYAPTVTNGPTPPKPTTPVVTDGAGSFVAAWDGQFDMNAILPMDFLRVDIHIGNSSDFIPSHDNRFGSIGAPTGGSITVGAATGTYYVKLVCWTLAGKVSDATIAVPAHSAETGGASSDGDAPASSPLPEALPGVEAIYVRWTPIVNADTVTYEVHISLTSGFTPDSTTKAGETVGSIFTIKTLPGAPPADPSQPDPRVFTFGTTYYIKIVAKDDDGSAAPSTQALASVSQLSGGSIADNTITALQVVAGSFTGQEFAGEVAVFSQFKTAVTGQRLEWGINGIQQYRSDNSRRFYVPPTDDEDIFIDAQIKARGLQVVGGASFEGTQNSIEKDGALRLASGVSSSSISTPAASVYYDTSRFNMPSTTPTGILGGFVLNPTEVNAIAWTPASKIKVYQYRANEGTRIWQFDPTTGNYENHIDQQDYEIMGEAWDPANPANGYMMFRWMPDGSGGKNGTQYYVAHANTFNKYSRADGTRFPSIGWVGSNFFTAEVLSATGRVQIRQYSSTLGPDGGNLPAPLSSFQTATTLSYLAIRPQCLWGNFAGGVGGNRFVISENGGAANIYMFDASGNWLMDDQFEAPTTKRGILYDGSVFRTYGNDGNLYKHTTFTWTAATSSKLWTELTLRDGVGTTHETTPGPAGSITMKRRANVKVSFPDLPFAGSGNPDDPDRWVFYAGRGATIPANTAMWKQSEALDGTDQVIYTSLATTGTNPPTSNNFPGATPGEIRNDALNLRIKGDGSIQGATIVAPVIKVGADLATGLPAATDGPYWLGYLSSAGSVPAVNTLTTLTGWSLLESDGVTLSSGVFTVPRAGVYRVSGQIWWAGVASAQGTRLVQAVKTSGSAAVIASVTVNAPIGTTVAPELCQWSKLFRLAANDTVIVRYQHNSAGSEANRIPTATNQDISFFQLVWDRP